MGKKIRTFYALVTDLTEKTYDIVGPMTNDQPWFERIQEAKAKTGHDITLGSFSEDIYSAADLQLFEIQQGLTRKKGIVSAPLENSSLFDGSIPKYAEKADRSRLIKLLCKGKCASTSFAELNAPYPNKELLKSASIGTYRATCLRCGQIATDNYNWFR